MKKFTKLLMFTFLGMFLSLSSCSNQGGPNKPVDPKDLRTTYLVLGDGGLYEGQPGKSFAHLSLENAVEYVAGKGTELPNASKVTNSNGQVLHYWYSVLGTGHDEITYIVPDAQYSVLYAKYGDGTPSVMRVYFKSPAEWKNANIYVWTNNNESMAGWPGTPMPKNDNGLWYFDYDTNTYPNVIFNNGSEQTTDLKSPTSEDKDCYVWNNGWYNEDTTEEPGGTGGGGDIDVGPNPMRVYFKSPSDWTKANIYTWTSSSAPMAAWPGVPMNKDDESGLWYFDYDTSYYPNVIFNDGTNQTDDLLSPTSEDKDCYVWENDWYNEDTTEEPGGSGGSVYVPTIYLKPNANWLTDNPRFVIYMWNDNGHIWYPMSDDDGDGIYEANIDEGYYSLIFCRMTPDSSDNIWDNVWNQTNDLSTPSDGSNLYTLAADAWTNGNGSWSTYTPSN